MEQKWYEKTYRRTFLDFHINDWNEEFLSQFDAEEFARCVVLAKSATTTVMANTHTGLCNYPTKVGEMHARLKGRVIVLSMLTGTGTIILRLELWMQKERVKNF